MAHRGCRRPSGRPISRRHSAGAMSWHVRVRGTHELIMVTRGRNFAVRLAPRAIGESDSWQKEGQQEGQGRRTTRFLSAHRHISCKFSRCASAKHRTGKISRPAHFGSNFPKSWPEPRSRAKGIYTRYLLSPCWLWLWLWLLL